MKIFTDKETAQARYDVCKKCKNFNLTTTQCSKCSCFMKLKVKLNNINCPIGKW